MNGHRSIWIKPVYQQAQKLTVVEYYPDASTVFRNQGTDICGFFLRTLARWPLVVKAARSQVLQTCFFLGAGVAAGVDGLIESDSWPKGEEGGDSGRYGEFENWEW